MMENQNTFDMTENIPDEMDTGPMHGEDLKKIK